VTKLDFKGRKVDERLSGVKKAFDQQPCVYVRSFWINMKSPNAFQRLEKQILVPGVEKNPADIVIM